MLDSSMIGLESFLVDGNDLEHHVLKMPDATSDSVQLKKPQNDMER